MVQCSCRPAALRAALILVLAAATTVLSTARAEEPQAPARRGPSIHAPGLKRLQQRALMQGARRHMERAQALERLRREHPEQIQAPAGVRRPREWGEGGGPQGMEPRAPFLPAIAPASAAQVLQPNVIVNDRGSDPYAGIGQAEQMVAAHGQNVLIAWNDGLGFEPSSGTTSTQGYGYSADGGLTYTDGGVPPTLPTWSWTSDPLVTVNEKTGDFWYCALVDVGTTQNGIGVVKGNFVADTVQWSTPTLVRVGSNFSVLFDKPWMVVDSLSNRLYLSYTVFSAVADTIVFQRSAPGGATWDDPQRLSDDFNAGYVQGSRPVVGPDGEVYVVWYLIDVYDPDAADKMRIRKSTNQGQSFAAAVNAASLFSNFGSGPPGFNRGTGITFPGVAADRSTGPRRGRVYVSWNESINFYDDPLGTGLSRSETESNNSAGVADPFTVGEKVRGSISNGSDFDYFSFSGTAGQTVIFYADSVAATLDMSLRLFCTNGATRLAFSSVGGGAGNLVVYTLPVSGTYFMRTASMDGSTGPYRIQTGFDTFSPGQRALDHRDVFVTWSDDGTTWSTPARASDSPANYDDSFPEVVVAGDHPNPLVGSGRPYCLWYDWRESAPAVCGATSHVYLSRSNDGGDSWTAPDLITEAYTNWSDVMSNIAPNQGDYLHMYADDANLYISWADGRNGDPDVYAVTVPLLTTPAEVALASARAEPDRVVLTWYAGAHSGFSATVERRETTTGFRTIGQASAEGDGSVTFADRDVTPGARYAYRLAWYEGLTPRTTPEVWVDVPAAAAFALHGAQPNPALEGVLVSFALPDATPATLELLDVTGRRLSERRVTGPGAQVVDLSRGLALEPGVYLVRLTRGSQSLTARAIVMR
jgi:hypothetical protein